VARTRQRQRYCRTAQSAKQPLVVGNLALRSLVMLIAAVSEASDGSVVECAPRAPGLAATVSAAAALLIAADGRVIVPQRGVGRRGCAARSSGHDSGGKLASV
jgi:hypothetical protein